VIIESTEPTIGMQARPVNARRGTLAAAPPGGVVGCAGFWDAMRLKRGLDPAF
jgi:hypothetical protein